jgi:lipopolysaccharide/colanic/teichoic acid biosynthesis glycosyltransferase
MLIAIGPLFALIGLAIRLDTPGPIFYRQSRRDVSQQLNGYVGEARTAHDALRRLELDLEYIRSRSVWFYFRVLFRRVVAASW